MTDPISDIEDRKMWMDMGKQALLIMQGAIEEGASMPEAMAVVTAFYAGMFRGGKEDEDRGTDTGES